jgi:hypothetical protein
MDALDLILVGGGELLTLWVRTTSGGVIWVECWSRGAAAVPHGRPGPVIGGRWGVAGAPGEQGNSFLGKSALSNLRKARDRVARRYNARRRQADFRVGELVLLRSHPLSSKSHQRSAKLEYRWSEPLKVARFVSPVTVLLANPDTGVIIRKAHVSQLKRHYIGE